MFLGHKGKWCRLNANPQLEMPKVGMSHSNTPVCEQTFSWMNKFRNLKTMNEAHFKLFILYVIDLHNLKIEGKVDLLANPLNPRRCQEILKLNQDNLLKSLGNLDIQEKVQSPSSESEPSHEDQLLKNLGNLGIQDKVPTSEPAPESIEDGGFLELPNGDLTCNFCAGTFKRLGNMRNHLNSKHNKSYGLRCSSCGKEFQDARKLSRHLKSCKK